MNTSKYGRRVIRLAAVGAIAAVVGATLAGCSSGEQSFAIGAKNPTGTVQLWDRSAIDPWTKEVVAAFNKSHKDLQVKMTSINDSQLTTKLSTVFRTNDVPDLVTTDDVDALPFIDSGNMLDITKQVDASPLKSVMSPAQLDLATVGGKIYGTPAVLDASVLVYNKDLFAKAGIQGPPANLDEMLADAKAIRALGSNTYGFNFAGNCSGCLTFTVLPNLYAEKSDVFTGTDLHAQKATVEGNAELEKTLQFYQDVWKDGLAPKSVQTDNGSLWNKNFQTGNIGMAPAPLSTYSSATAAQKKWMGIAPLPGVTGGISTYVGGANFGIPKKAKNAAGAWEFIQFALSKKMQELTPTAGFAPTRTDLVNDPAFAAKYPQVVPGLTAAKTGSAPRTLYHNQLFSLPAGPWQTMFTKAVFGGDIPGAMKAGQTGFTNVLNGSGN